ncbi:MAG: hypothetical protein KF729_17655 [Sandaracinaceae bacterium]|nr:hypothetical protein [Sandaracinaceae bacterium]
MRLLAALALGLLAAGCQCSPGRVGARPLDGGGMDAAGGFDAGSDDGAIGPDGASDGATPIGDGGRDAGRPPLFETRCDDGIDDDDDGRTDCEDEDCEGAACDVAGGRCRFAACDGCRGAPTETMCGDGVDDDCDGLRDCADPDCDGIECGPDGIVCASSACPCGDGFSEWSCHDGADNDCDGLVDCADPDCDRARCSATGEICMSGSCACPSGMELCQGIDDDCDGLIDDGCPRTIAQGPPSTSSPVGGDVGTAWADPCPMGTALIGVAGAASARVDRLQPLCAVVRFVVDERLSFANPEHRFFVETGAPIVGSVHGGAGGTAFEDRCPEHQFVVAVEGHADLGGLDRIALRCASFSIARDDGFTWRLRSSPGGSTPSRGGAGTGELPFAHECGANAVVTGLEGRASTHVTSLATSCRALSLELR